MSMAPAGHVVVACGPYPDVGAGVGGPGGGGEDAAPVAHCFTVPGIGSPNTLLVHDVPPVNVWYAYTPLAPYRTCFVPVKAHVPPSVAQNVQSLDPLVYVTVTEKLQRAVWPSLDCAETLTVVAPTGNAVPEAGLPVVEIGATPPEVVAV